MAIQTEVTIVSYFDLFPTLFPTCLIRNNLNAIALLESYLGVNPKNGLIKTESLQYLVESSRIYTQPAIIFESNNPEVTAYVFPSYALQHKITEPKLLALVKTCANIYQQSHAQGVIPLLVNLAPEFDDKCNHSWWALLGIMGKTIQLQQHYTRYA